MDLNIPEPRLSLLGDALARAQGEIRAATKDQENPHFRMRYADLASVWDACRAPLSRYGLSVIQVTEVVEGKLYLVTILLHSSGERIESRYPVRPMRQAKGEGWVDSQDPQSLGSALTYARRYNLAAIVGIASEEDDDGETGSGRASGPAKGAPSNTQAKSSGGGSVITAPQVGRLKTIQAKSDKTEKQVKDHIYVLLGIDSTKDIPRDRYDEVIAWIEKPLKPQNG